MTAFPDREDTALDGVQGHLRDIGVARVTPHGRLDAVDRLETVDRFLQDVATDNGAAVAKMTRSVLSGMCGLAARHDAVPRNPVKDARSITQPRRATPKSLTLAQVRQLRAMITYDNTAVARDLPDFVAFMHATGLRIGEASAITWDAVDLDAGTVEVRGTVIRLKGQACSSHRRPRAPPACALSPYRPGASRSSNTERNT